MIDGPASIIIVVALAFPLFPFTCTVVPFGRIAVVGWVVDVDAEDALRAAWARFPAGRRERGERWVRKLIVHSYRKNKRNQIHRFDKK
jgi:hypothetical protein